MAPRPILQQLKSHPTYRPKFVISVLIQIFLASGSARQRDANLDESLNAAFLLLHAFVYVFKHILLS